MCVFCDRNCENYSVKSLLKRVNEGRVDCTACKEDNDEKQQLQSERLKGNKIGKGIGVKYKTQKTKISELSNNELMNMSTISFNNETQQFKTEYYNSNHTLKEFQNLRKKIISINGIDIADEKRYIYYPHLKVNNECRYFPRIYDKENDILSKILYIKYKCECCTNIFVNRDLSVQKNRHKTLCKDCRFTNDAFKVRSCLNVLNETIVYRSKLEKELIDYCNENNIPIKIGPVIDYIFNSKARRYFVDFAINDILVETKGMHIWHKKELESGKWQAKENAARNYITTSDSYTEYRIVFPEQLKEFEKYLLDKI